jgi:hypothetical protein
MTDTRRPRTPLGSRLGHARAAPGQIFYDRRLTGNGSSASVVGLSTRAQDALIFSVSNDYFVWKLRIAKLRKQMIAITLISLFRFVSCLVEFSLIQTENAVASAPTRSSHSKTSRDERTLTIGKGAHSWSSAMTKRATKIAASLINDPAVKAWRLVQEAGEDDSAYDEAIDMFERARVTSPVGLKLKQKLLQMRRALIYPTAAR